MTQNLYNFSSGEFNVLFWSPRSAKHIHISKIVTLKKNQGRIMSKKVREVHILKLTETRNILEMFYL